MRFYPYGGKWGNDFIFQKINFENLKKLESTAKFFFFFTKMSKQRISLFLNNPPLVQPLLF